jgi:hypothetical protein
MKDVNDKRRIMTEQRLENLKKARARAVVVRAEKAQMKQDIKLADQLAFKQKHLEAKSRIEATIKAPKEVPKTTLLEPEEYESEGDEVVVARKPKKVARSAQRMVYVDEPEMSEIDPHFSAAYDKLFS